MIDVRVLLLTASIVLSLLGGLLSTAGDLDLATFGRVLLVSCVVVGGLVVLIDQAERW